MFETHFQLQRRPFPSVPTPDRYFAASTIENARLSLIRLIQRDEGPGLVIGAAGTGKTMLCRVLEETLRDECRIVRLPSARLRDRRALLQSILYELGQPYRDLDEGELRLALIDHVTDRSACPGGILILVDEAESLALSLLDELRTMTNLTSTGQACVRLILLGSRRLEEKFADPRMESFAQRIAGRFYLESYSHEEARQYVNQQIVESGGDPQMMMSEEAIDTIFRATEGVPRLINQLCDHAMILCTINGVGRLSAADVEAAWTDLQQLPLPRAPIQDASHTELPDIVEFGQLDSEQVAESVEATIETIEQELPPETPSEPPEVELVLHDDRVPDPFNETFEEEFVVIDQYATPDDLSQRHQRQVICEDSHQIASQLDEVLRQIRRATEPSNEGGVEADATSRIVEEDAEPDIVSFSPPESDETESSDEVDGHDESFAEPTTETTDLLDVEESEARPEAEDNEPLDDPATPANEPVAVETREDSLAMAVGSTDEGKPQSADASSTKDEVETQKLEPTIENPSKPSSPKKTYRNLFTRLQKRD